MAAQLGNKQAYGIEGLRVADVHAREPFSLMHTGPDAVVKSVLVRDRNFAWDSDGTFEDILAEGHGGDSPFQRFRGRLVGSTIADAVGAFKYAHGAALERVVIEGSDAFARANTIFYDGGRVETARPVFGDWIADQGSEDGYWKRVGNTEQPPLPYSFAITARLDFVKNLGNARDSRFIIQTVERIEDGVGDGTRVFAVNAPEVPGVTLIDLGEYMTAAVLPLPEATKFLEKAHPLAKPIPEVVA